MIATWMLYCALCAAWLGAVAALVERVLLAARRPIRGVWVAATACSLLVPLLALRRTSAPVAPVATSRAPPGAVVRQVGATPAIGGADAGASLGAPIGI